MKRILLDPWQKVALQLNGAYAQTFDVAQALGITNDALIQIIQECAIPFNLATGLIFIDSLPILLEYIGWSPDAIAAAMLQLEPDDDFGPVQGQRGLIRYRDDYEAEEEEERGEEEEEEEYRYSRPSSDVKKAKGLKNGQSWYVTLGDPWLVAAWDVRGLFERVKAPDISRVLGLPWKEFLSIYENVAPIWGPKKKPWLNLEHIPLLLKHMGWDEAKIARAMAQFSVEKRHAEPQGEPQKTKPLFTSRNFLSLQPIVNERKIKTPPASPPPLIPEWFEELAHSIQYYLDPKSVEAYMKTPEFEEEKKRIVARELAKLEPALREGLKKFN